MLGTGKQNYARDVKQVFNDETTREEVACSLEKQAPVLGVGVFQI